MNYIEHRDKEESRIHRGLETFVEINEKELTSLRSELDLSKKHNLYLTKTSESQSQQIAGYGNEVLKLRSELEEERRTGRIEWERLQVTEIDRLKSELALKEKRIFEMQQMLKKAHLLSVAADKVIYEYKRLQTYPSDRESLKESLEVYDQLKNTKPNNTTNEDTDRDSK